MSSQRRRLVTRSRALSSDDIQVVDARHREERKGAFGEIPEWNPALHTGSKASIAFNKAYYYTPEPVRSSLKFPLTWNELKTSLLIWIPILQWSWTYRAKDLIGDLVAGFTIGMTHIPQGIGFALLAQLPVVHGLYSSFVPVLVYSLFGTSRHISVGTFPVVALMVGTAVQRLSNSCDDGAGNTADISDMSTDNSSDSSGMGNGTVAPAAVAACEDNSVDIAVTLCLLVGVFMIIARFLQMGFITLFLSEALVSGYTCAASFAILTTQISFLLGLNRMAAAVDPGPFDTPRKFTRYMELLFQGGANAGAVVTSFICIIFLIVMNYVNIFIKKKFPRFPFPIPSQIILVILATGISHIAKLSDTPTQLPVVGKITTGAPPVTQPQFSLLSQLIVDAFVITIVSYVINISQAKLLAKKNCYPIYPNQEFFAYGMMNFIGSFFGSFATAGALSRSILQDTSGGNTQLVGIVSSGIVFIVILFLGHLFESLPTAALAAIIVVALKGLYLQVRDTKQLWIISKHDMIVWVVVFFSTLFIGLDIGLLVGVSFSLFQVIIFTILPHSASLGATERWIPDEDINTEVEPVKGVFIFRFQSPLYFANISIFRSRLALRTGIDPLAIKIDDTRELGCFESCYNKVRYRKYVYDTERAGKELTTIHDDGLYYALNNEEEHSLSYPSPKPSPQVPRKTNETLEDSVFVHVGANEEDNDENEPVIDNETNSNQSPPEENELTQPFLQRQKLMKTAKRYQTRRTLNKSSVASLTRSHSLSLNASVSLSHRLQSVSREYRRQNTLTRSRSNTATSVKDDNAVTETNVPYHTIIIDCAPIAFVDSMGTRALYQLINDYDKLGIQVLLAAPAPPICCKLAVIGFFQRFGPQWVFPSIQGAVEFAKSGEKVTPQLAQEHLDYQFQNWEEKQVMSAALNRYEGHWLLFGSGHHRHT